MVSQTYPLAPLTVDPGHLPLAAGHFFHCLMNLQKNVLTRCSLSGLIRHVTSILVASGQASQALSPSKLHMAAFSVPGSGEMGQRWCHPARWLSGFPLLFPARSSWSGIFPVRVLSSSSIWDLVLMLYLLAIVQGQDPGPAGMKFKGVHDSPLEHQAGLLRPSPGPKRVQSCYQAQSGSVPCMQTKWCKISLPGDTG